MPVYKDSKTNTWYCKFYYSTWQGVRKQTTKRGFKTKKEAQQWENEKKAASSGNLNITMETFVNIYFEDKEGVSIPRRKIHPMIDSYLRRFILDGIVE